MKKQVVISIIVFSFMVLATIVVALYGKGYRFRFNNGQPKLSKTGLLVATSSPNGAQIFINGHLTSATDDTINLLPGEYSLEIVKQGYFPWKKMVKVQQEVVTKADALLFPQAPKLESITTIGVTNPVTDQSNGKIAFQISSQSTDKKNGIFVLDMNASSVPVLSQQSSAIQIVDDTTDTFSKSFMTWSPDGQEMIASTSATPSISGTIGNTSYLLKTNSMNDTPQDVTAILSGVQDSWNKEEADNNRARISPLKSDLRKLINTDFKIINWSPDETRILYTASESAELPIMIKPRRIGINTLFEDRSIKKGSVYVYDVKEDVNVKITDKISLSCIDAERCHMPIQWFPDSDHLIYVHDKRIVVMDYDGSNQVTVYAGPFVDSYVFPWPNGSKLVILTNLDNADIPTNLYTISLK